MLEQRLGYAKPRTRLEVKQITDSINALQLTPVVGIVKVSTCNCIKIVVSIYKINFYIRSDLAYWLSGSLLMN
ncbi:hypothetical protein LMG29542_07485 [Paraburkholderia humisilvae]|uniref:Uncharacterized protein n=1 Tax=Paraburkholderia humisilvae TaxID=627669 RepID=A0A6J5F4V9_9BURK|nr:hypothetical protein LMG29542_07485 [Paraburkholderia humisilvae]